MTELFESTARCLRETRPEEKCDCTLQLFGQWRAGEVGFEPERAAISIDEPGRPERPELVHPRDLPRRSLGSDEGRAALIHAIAHIEFNAINLALDHAYRFRGMPEDYYGDWLRIAAEEAEAMASVPVEEALIGLGGPPVLGLPAAASVPVTGRDHTVTRDDVARALAATVGRTVGLGELGVGAVGENCVLPLVGDHLAQAQIAGDENIQQYEFILDEFEAGPLRHGQGVLADRGGVLRGRRRPRRGAREAGLRQVRGGVDAARADGARIEAHVLGTQDPQPRGRVSSPPVLAARGPARTLPRR